MTAMIERNIFVTNEATCAFCGHIASECECDIVTNDEDLDDEDDENDDWEEVEEDEVEDDFDDDQDEPFFDEEDETVTVNKNALTYVGMPSEMEAIANAGRPTLNAAEKPCRESKKPTENAKYSPSGQRLTPMGGGPSEYLK